MDHNEKSQAVNGIEEAEVQEIIDHQTGRSGDNRTGIFPESAGWMYRLRSFTRCIRKSGVEVEPQMAGLLCSAIISDTLLFRSPTCTMVDQAAAEALARDCRD